MNVNTKDINITSDCPLCDQHGLNVVGEGDDKVMQCLNCGYVSTKEYLGTKKTNKAFQKLHEDLQEWVIENNDRLWLPVQLTLPFGMLYPVNVEELQEDGSKIKNMKWAFVPTIDVSEDEKEKYPNPDGGFYDKRYDMESIKFYDDFLTALAKIRMDMDEETKSVNEGLSDTLEKLKKL